MRTSTRYLAVLGALVLVIAACTGGASPAPAGTEQPSAPASGSAAASPSTAASPSANPDDLLAKIKAAGVLKVSTDAAYPPQSELKDGKWEGFDVDVATEIAKRLGVTVEFTAQDWAVITAGNWGGRWDISVGSMTITAERSKTFDFSPPYYYTPAQIAASKKSGITDLAGLAGKTICAGEATTYWTWLTARRSTRPSRTASRWSRSATRSTSSRWRSRSTGTARCTATSCPR
jgi:polar amino acid transport system substrate-binding protein